MNGGYMNYVCSQLHTIETVYQQGEFAMKYVFILCSVVLTLVGCASAPLPQGYSGTTNVVNIPELNTEANAEVGQTIVSKANVTKSVAIIVSNAVSETVNIPGTTTIPAGTIPLFASNESGKFYRDSRATYTMLGATVPANAGIYVPDDATKPAVIYHFALKYIYGNTPVIGIKNTTTEKWGKDSFKRELVYSGVSQNTISILYREFSNDMARPAFSQDLKYDLTQGKEIGFKGARFEVIKANNTGIVYKVLKPLD